MHIVVRRHFEPDKNGVERLHIFRFWVFFPNLIFDSYISQERRTKRRGWTTIAAWDLHQKSSQGFYVTEPVMPDADIEKQALKVAHRAMKIRYKHLEKKK